MTIIKTNSREEINVLTEEEIIQLHELLTTHDEISNRTEHVSTAGIMDYNLI